MEGDYTDDEGVVIRNLRTEDRSRLVAIDKQLTGRSRQVWYEGKLKRALEDSDLQVSLGAEIDGTLVGAMIAAVHFGEFGLPEPLAVLDTVLVDPAFERRGIARAMFEQLLLNLRALRIERVRTEVAWDDHKLAAFFGSVGFEPVPRLVLEKEISRV
ncbi:MAG: GNAT family N-acetyltransferase [Thermoanaerobaculales bacterium]